MTGAVVPIVPDDFQSRQSLRLQRDTQRPADQPGADDRDTSLAVEATHVTSLSNP